MPSPSSTTAHTRPLAPSSRASSISSSPTLRLTPAPAPGTTSPRTTPPAAMAPSKTPKPEAPARSVQSRISMPKRMSGRSVPKRRIASA